jgi:hypothetical protein
VAARAATAETDSAMLLLWSIACTHVETGEPEAVVHPVTVELSPATVDFGMPEVDELAFQAVSITNNGDVDVSILEGHAPPFVEVDFHGLYTIGAGDTIWVDLVWSPAEPGSLLGGLELVLATDTDQASMEVPLVGTARGPTLTWSAAEVQFGEVSVGCDREFGLTVSNTGTGDLVVDRLVLQGDPAITMRPVEVPFTLGPFKSLDLDLEFVPDDLDPAQAVVQLESELGVATVAVSGQGKADGESTLSFVVGEQKKMTVLWHVNAVAIPGTSGMGTHASRLAGSLDTYFRTLQEEGASYRVGFLWNQAGTMDAAYIDDSLSPEEATSRALEMLEAGAITDVDQTFTTFMMALEEQADWLFEDASWEDSKLSFVAVQRDVEQSGGLAADYVRRAREYKEDPEDIVFHAIAGTMPMGCGEGTEPFMGYADAVTETGGTFAALCEPDWDETMAALAVATAAGSRYFPLQGTVLADSLVVRVDGVKQTVGWEFRSDLNAIEFEDDFYPSQGATVDVFYLHPTGCE